MNEPELRKARESFDKLCMGLAMPSLPIRDMLIVIERQQRQIDRLRERLDERDSDGYGDDPG